MTQFRSSQDFHAGSIARRSAEKVLDYFKGDFTKAAASQQVQEENKVQLPSLGLFAEYLHAPLLDICKMHKEDNIQAIVSTLRLSLVQEEKEAKHQLRRAVEFHEMFYQAADFFSKLQEGTTPRNRGVFL